jgi:hypothetical protein
MKLTIQVNSTDLEIAVREYVLNQVTAHYAHELTNPIVRFVVNGSEVEAEVDLLVSERRQDGKK